MRRVVLVLMVSLIATALCSAAFATVTTGPPSPVSKVVEGSITAITLATPTSGKITVAPAPGLRAAPTLAPVTFIVNEKTKLVKDGKECNLAAIAVGDSCRALVVKNAEGGLVALMVYAKTVARPIKVDKGTIIDKAVVNKVRTFKLKMPATAALPEVIRWFAVNDKTRITVGGKPAGYELLANGQTAEVAYVLPLPSPLTVVQPIIALSVAAKNPPPPPPVIHVIGRLASVDLAGGIIVVNPRGTNALIPFKITDATKIDKFGPAPLAALIPGGVVPRYPGDTVDVTRSMMPTLSGVPSAAISVLVLPESIAGVIVGVVVNPDGVTGTVAIGPGAATGGVIPAEQFKVVPETKIFKDGAPATIVQLAKTDFATVKFFQFKDGKIAGLIEARSSTLPPPPPPL